MSMPSRIGLNQPNSINIVFDNLQNNEVEPLLFCGGVFSKLLLEILRHYLLYARAWRLLVCAPMKMRLKYLALYIEVYLVSIRLFILIHGITRFTLRRELTFVIINAKFDTRM